MFTSFLFELNQSKKYFISNQLTTRNRYEPTLLDTHAGGDKLEWVQIECGELHTVGLTKKGEVFTWGDNKFGQLGHGDREERIVPTKVLGLDGLVITKFSCGRFHTAALTDKGEMLTWYVRL